MGVEDIPILDATAVEDSPTPEYEIDVNILYEQSFPPGLAQTLIKTKDEFALRIWVIDNSGSMKIADGHKILETSNCEDVKPVSCTRWSELLQTIQYHADMAQYLQAPTIFRLLNDPGNDVGPQQFSIAANGVDKINDELKTALDIMKKIIPKGATPLTEHIAIIRNIIQSYEPTLNRDGTKVVVIIATDGIPTNEQGKSDALTRKNFIDHLHSLINLPVKIILRLCTDEKEVVKFYNNLDRQFESFLEVLDDFSHEAKEINVHNPWLNYALPLHRCREMGYSNKIIDILDTQFLERDELVEFLVILFGSKIDDLPSPMTDWDGFVNGLKTVMTEEKMMPWNPIRKKVGPWIEIKNLEKVLDDKRSCAVM
jgi:hypothetical protein